MPDSSVGLTETWLAELRGPIHGRIQTLRGMCTDERPHTEIDIKLTELDELVYALGDQIDGYEVQASEAIPLSEMHDLREVREKVPVFDPERGHRLRTRVYATWRDSEGRLAGLWRWDDA